MGGRRTPCLRFMALLVGATAQPANAGDWSFSGEIVPEVRAYVDAPRYGDPSNPFLRRLTETFRDRWPDFGIPFTGQSNQRLWSSVATRLTVTYEWNDGADTIVVSPFARFAVNDERRTHADLREGHWLHVEDNWDTVIGFSKVFWGVAESRHLVDIINQDDQVEDIDQDEKLGQPMINANIFGDWGTLSLFYLPYFRERTFESNNARFRGPLPIDTDDARYESSLKRWHPDVAVRFEKTFKSLDVGLSAFHGTSREPSLQVRIGKDGVFAVPYYDIMTQIGFDGLLVTGDWLWKLEALTRWGQGYPFGAAVGGFEYTFTNVRDSNIDVGLLLEYNYDGRGPDAPPVFINNDLFVGTRLTFNDERDTNLLAGASIDLENAATYINIEFMRRLRDGWKLEIDGRFFVNVPKDDVPLYFISADSFVQMRISNYF